MATSLNCHSEVDKVINVTNYVTGEIIEVEKADDETLMQAIREMQTHEQRLQGSLRMLTAVLADRMKHEGATLKITSQGKARIRFTARVKDKNRVLALYKECPELFKARCFQTEIKPMKAGLKELAKLNADFKAKVDELYEMTPSMTFEWGTEMNAAVEDEGEELPF